MTASGQIEASDENANYICGTHACVKSEFHVCIEGILAATIFAFLRVECV